MRILLPAALCLLAALPICAQTPAPPTRLGLCAACHGAGGHAGMPGVPHLAGQRLDYLRGRHLVLRKEMFAYRREMVIWTSWGLLLGVVNVVIVWYGGHLHLRGRASIGDIMAFQWYTFLLLNPVWNIVNSFSELQRSLAAMERVFELLAMEADKPDRPGAVAAPTVVDELRFEHVEFAYREGRPVVLQDDHDREDEADLIVAAECLTTRTMALFIRECSGIVCLCLSDEKVRALDLPPMVPHNESRNRTAFTVTIEARDGVSTGVSAADRVTTIRAAIAPDAKPSDIVRPGHVFPLRAAPGGVLARRGHTEGTVDLAVLAGLAPAGVLCELMNPDGTMARGAQVERFAAGHKLPMLTIAELFEFRQSLAAARDRECCVDEA